MRFHSDGPAIPDLLLERCDAGRVVFLCGAGVSLPSGMPTFVGLTQHVIECLDPPENSDIMVAFRPWLDPKSVANVPLDQIFNLLHLEYGKEEVNGLVTELMSNPLKIKKSSREHELIKRISSSQRGVPQIVTTNFDRLFESEHDAQFLALHEPPAFPDLNFGSAMEGITYLHGRLVDATSEVHPYVLSSADFGRAYLSEGWATNFIRHLLERYTVVLVGYKAEDPPIKYLLQGLNHDGKYDRSKLYAFDRGRPEEIEAKWRDRGVTAIAYSNHSDLWKSMESWADRADNPRKWLLSLIAKCERDPKTMTPHERGQVAHILRSVQGARLFSEAEPTSHPEWICVMDATIRSGKQSRGYGDDAEIFDPFASYGLDDDLKDISDDDRMLGVSNDNLLVWRNGDDSPHEPHRLGSVFATIPKRLSHLISWIVKSMDYPVLAWWAIRQNGLHILLLQQIEWQLRHSKVLDDRPRHIWGLILEYQREPRNFKWNGEWFDFKNRLGVDGWTSSVLREFRRAAMPRIEIKPPYGLGQSRPPFVSWEKLQLSDLGQFEVAFLDRHSEELEVPDDLLSTIVGVMEEQFIIASELLEDIETVFFESPTCYPDREVDGDLHITKSAASIIWFVQLFDRMCTVWPEVAHAHAITWPANEKFFFRKLRLYSLSKAVAFNADQVAKEVLALSQDALWDINVARELLFLLVDRWKEFSQNTQNQLTDRILAGPNQHSYQSEEEFPRLKKELTARYARYLELNGCKLTDDRRDQLSEMILGISEWNNHWATSMVIERGSRGGVIGTDEKPDSLVKLSVTEVVSRAKQDLKRDFNSLTEKRPFTGLVKAEPRKALSALTIEGKKNEYPYTFWSSMINDIPTDISPRLKRTFLNRVARLPHSVVSELRHPLCRWLEQNLAAFIVFDEDLSWTVFDHIVDGLLSTGDDAAKSSISDVHRVGKIIERSRRTFNHAINGPIGICVVALFHAISEGEREAGSLIPDHIKARIERLFGAPGEGADHAVSIASSRLNWLMFVDPAWTTARLLPMLSFDHPSSEPAWNGFFHGGRVPWPPLASIIKPLLINLFPWIERLAWNRDIANVAAQWIGVLRLFDPDEPGSITGFEMRSILRKMSDETRNRFIIWLGVVGSKNENGWTSLVIPLINEDWPKERQYRTASSIKAWIGVLDNAGEDFATVYASVRKFLVPVEIDDHLFYGLTRESGERKSIAESFPEATLDLMNKVTPTNLSRSPYELPKVLALIAEAETKLQSDPRFLRLLDLG